MIDVSKKSASGIARHISRILKQKGFNRFDAKYSPFGFNKECEGFAVCRVGYGKDVSVNWRTTEQFTYNSKEKMAELKNKKQELINAVKDMGYPINEQGYITCGYH